MKELTGYAEHLDHEAGAYGDPRRCPRHPSVQTSSPDGMFDAPCGACEAESDFAAMVWDFDPANAHRRRCRLRDYLVAVPENCAATCQDAVDPNEIAF